MQLITMILATTLFLTACGRQSSEEQIARNIAAIEEAVEQNNFYSIEEHLHDSFLANDRMSIDEIRQLLRLHSLRHKTLGVTIVGSNTTMHENFSDRAHSVVSVIVTGSSGLLPSDGSIQRVEIDWVEDSGDWLIRRASWR